MDRKEYMKEYNKKYREKNKEYYKEYMKEYNKEYQKNNKEKIAVKKKEYRKSDKGLKSDRIGHWKFRGVISDDYDKLYEYYLSIKECENCGIELDNGTNTTKCLDHCHETGQFRNILCGYCNIIRY
tara:strand:+ start:425 stop:802 length:378 start_codon:yes stop_codon:yes gene_type:complete